MTDLNAMVDLMPPRCSTCGGGGGIKDDFMIRDCPDCDAAAQAKATRKRWARDDPRRTPPDYYLTG